MTDYEVLKRLDRVNSRIAGIEANLGYAVSQATIVTGLDQNASGTANAAALSAAIAAADAGASLQLPEGRFKLDTVTISKDLRIAGVPGKTILENPTDANYVLTLLYVQGVVNDTPKTTLTAAALPGANTLYVASTSGLSAGEWIMVRDTRFMGDWNSQDTVNQDMVQIESIVSATEIRLRTVLTRVYLTGRSAGVHQFTTTPPQVFLEGITCSRGRIDLTHAVNCYLRDCHVEQSDLAAFSFRVCTGCVMEDCSTENPHDRTAATYGQTFYLYNCAFCTVIRHTARWCEGAVLRRGTRYCDIIDCRFEGATTGLATYTGDCHHNTVQDCVFIDALLTWGAGGHYADSYNVSRNCEFYNNSAQSIGNGGSALAELALSYDGRALKAGATYGHAFENGAAFIAYGTTIPTGMTKSKRYYAICPTYNGTNSEFLPSDRLPKPVATVTFNNTTKVVDAGDGWATSDGVVFDGVSMPTGLSRNKIYFLRNLSGTTYYLQNRPGQTATFDNTTDRVTLVSAAGTEWQDGDAVMFVTAGTLPAELTGAPTVYYLRDKSGADSFKLAATAGGAAIGLSTNGSGTIYVVHGFTTAGSGTIRMYGGTPLSISGSTSAATITTVGEGNVFEGHVISNPSANAIYMHRCAGTIYRNIRFVGASNSTSGSCLFTLSSNTDVDIINCFDENGLNVSLNRIAHLSTCFNVNLVGGRYNKRTTGNLITGGSSENIVVTGVDIPQLSAIDSLFGSSILPNARVKFTPNRIQTVAYATPTSVHLGLECLKTISLTGDLELTGTGYVVGSLVELLLVADGTPRNLTFPTDWKFVPAKPASIAANKTGLLTLRSTTTAATGVVATWEVQS